MTVITTKHLKNYQAASHLIDNLHLTFEIRDSIVKVTSLGDYTTNNQADYLTLDGSAQLESVTIDGAPAEYELKNDKLTLYNLPDKFCLEIITHVDAFNNKSCMGLYASNGNLFTQCEPEGFRKITYYLDRPDVMTSFTTTIIANQEKFPILLSNGNKIQEQQLENGNHQVTWHDPFKKPSYLFALVAGKFAKINDIFVTKSGRNVQLEVYSEAESLNQCQHCLESLKRAMKWDEERFSLEYDLDIYMIVASGDFNMGAMENKGLNIFNTKYVLADSKTATDTDFINVEAVVGHEYFHNWTGNRVTCRDWFQLSLKEGLTVFRDQEFTSDLHSRAVKRIQDVKTLRQLQFAEDASPLSHPVRPESYIEINNFYTMTIYEKGAEVVRMYQTILGKDGFKKGMDLYFKRHDGQAVTCDDFCQAMADANQIDLGQFMLWYSQAGTPRIVVTENYDAVKQEYSLTFEQGIPNNPTAKPMLIPVKIGLLSEAGHELELITENDSIIIKSDNELTLLLNKKITTYTFKQIPARSTPSLLRQFSAPVIIDYNYTDEQLINLASHDSDSFNQWEALQALYRKQIKQLYQTDSLSAEKLNPRLATALIELINNRDIDPALKALALNLPACAELSIEYKDLDIHKLSNVINFLKQSLANQLELALFDTYKQVSEIKENDQNIKGYRSLKNVALGYLIASNNYKSYISLAQTQYSGADNMTDKIGVLSAINDTDCALRDKLLKEFLSEYKEFPLVMDKWFSIQAQSQLPDTINKVIGLTDHPQFDKANPNKLYSLIRTFTTNPVHFNTSKGYAFITSEVLRIDKFNSGVAGRIANAFSQISNFDKRYQVLVTPFLQQIMDNPNLSKDVYEIISKTLAQIKE